jgi:hypothetical protein
VSAIAPTRTVDVAPFKKPFLSREQPQLTCNNFTATAILTEDTSVTELELSSSDRILFHGYVHRFKPNLSQNFVERFLVINQSSIVCFRSKSTTMSSGFDLTKEWKPPLFVLSDGKVRCIRRLSSQELFSQFRIRSKKDSEVPLFEHLFEIVVDGGFLDETLARRNQVSDRSHKSQKPKKRQRGAFSPPPLTSDNIYSIDEVSEEDLDSPLKFKQYNSTKITSESWGTRQQSWSMAESRLIFAIDPKTDTINQIKPEFFTENESEGSQH